MEEKDAVIVGARCAGSTLAIGLAERGWDVLLVDRDTFPSETISTHGVYPNTLARFEQLGVMDTLRASHHVALLANRLVGLGHEVAGLFSPIDGYDRMAVIRRSALDKAIVDTALAAGAEARFGERVVDLIGSGTEEDPVSGVVMENGEPGEGEVGLRRRRAGLDGRAEARRSRRSAFRRARSRSCSPTGATSPTTATARWRSTNASSRAAPRWRTDSTC